MYTLVVVDMQADFHAAKGERVRKNVLREITQAMQDDADIIFLEYNDSGPTLPELTEPVISSGYRKYWHRTKHGDDGSDEAKRCMFNHKLNRKHIKVVGVNTDCCVASTVVGLISLLPNVTIDVIADACDSDWYHNRGIDMLKKNINVNVKE